jgi:flagellar basal-body rod modification protein FlgD
METSGITAAASQAAGFGAPAGQAMGKDAFMSLLVQQLKNQDPMEPTTNEDFIAQLANFSSLEEMQNLNENIVGMVYLQQGNALLQQLTDSSNLIGKEITFLDPQTQAEKKGVVDKVKIVDGQALLDVDGQDVPLAYVTEVTDGTTQDDGQV